MGKECQQFLYGGAGYLLQTLHAGEKFLLTRSVGDDPPRFLLIYDINAEWLSYILSSSYQETNVHRVGLVKQQLGNLLLYL